MEWTLHACAIAIMDRSLREVGIDVDTQARDIDVIEIGKPRSLQNKMSAILGLITDLQKETGIIEENIVVDEAKTRYKMTDEEAEKIIAQLIREGTIYSPRESFLKKT